MPLPTSKTGRITKQEFFAQAVEINRIAAGALGTAENPVTDPSAPRPTGIPTVWWRTATNPTNAIAGDWVFIVESATVATTPTTPTETVVYEQLFGTNIGSFVAETNAATLARTTTRDSGGELSWTNPATGSSRVKSPVFPLTTVQHTVTFSVGHNHTGSVLCNPQMYETDSAGNYVNFIGMFSTEVSNTGLTNITATFTPSGLPSGGVTPTHLRFLVEAQEIPTAGRTLYLGGVRIVK